jgi:mono/diheme cytochrome c family protein
MKKPNKPQSQQPARSQGGKPSEPSVSAAASVPSAGAAKPVVVIVKEVGGEPTMKRASVPVLLIALLVAMVYWGNMYIVEHGGELDARVHSPYRSFKEIADMQPKNEEQELIAKGFRVYNKPTCVACHQNDGNGSTAQNAPPLVGSEWVLEKDPSRLIRIVLHGLSGPIKVLGKEYGAGAMVGWKDTLTDEEIAHVLTYVRNSWGNKAPAVKPDQVKKVRDETKDWSGYTTVEELLKVTLKE